MEERFISVQEAQDILRVSTRQVQYHAANGKIGSRKIGRRLELLHDDVIRLAEELGADNRRPPQPSVEMVQDSGALIDYLREKDQQLLLMSRRVGELEGLLQQRLLPEDVEGLRQELAEQKAGGNYSKKKRTGFANNFAMRVSRGIGGYLGDVGPGPVKVSP